MIENCLLILLALAGVHLIVQTGIVRWHKVKFEFLKNTLTGSTTERKE